MKDLKLKIKRQTEILGLVISSPGKYQIYDFEEMFGVNDLTIKRDLQELRGLGIDIHSEGKKGINITSKIPIELLKAIIPQYIGIAVNQSTYDQATSLFISKLGENSIAILTELQICIDQTSTIKIKYQKPEEKAIEERVLEPYCIFQGDKHWRLLANHNGVVKQFLLNNIKSIEKLDKKFKPISQKQIDEIFGTSFKCWLGNERFTVRIKFLPPWPDRIKPKQYMEFQKVIENLDGSIEYETVVNSLNEIAAWIVSRGEGVVVLEPEKLKSIVIQTAKDVLKNYNE
ncbi:MAG: Helix-turn-helix type 11 domain-containing protein [Ignavibacteria bacterium]|nr:MAG: Helix-turn-helix type 11 domain-containing protein [Ignavibacteria bacterium]KAF0154931.1 MAG: Helix-turn-helix type 11 domain-containing protein [Ignavibacteria bacterium]